MYKQKRIRYIYDVNEINNLLAYCGEHFRKFIENPDAKDEFHAVPEKEIVGGNAWWTDKKVAFYLTFKDAMDKTCTYVFAKTDTNDKKYITGSIAYSTLKKYYKIPEILYPPYFSAAGLIWSNKKYNNKRTKAYGYDLNSSFPYAMLQDMPDTSKEPELLKIVEEDEIGFDRAGGLKYKGELADYVFKKITSPFKKFVEVWYNKKKNSPKESIEREKAKQMMNYAIGTLQNHNFWLRAAIIGYSNDLIKSKMDKNTLYCNTDSIISLTERPDLDIGENIGQFKIEHFNEDFAYIDTNYQWNTEAPHVKGTPRSWFRTNYDLLSNEKIPNLNHWLWNKENRRFIENKEWVKYNEKIK